MEAMIDYLNNINGPVVFCGDLNVAVSTHFDKTLVAEGPGYYKHELEFYTNLQDIGYADAIKDDDIVYTWWDPRARKENGIAATRNRNKGWRLDYFFTKNFNCNQIASKCLKHIGENNENHLYTLCNRVLTYESRGAGFYSTAILVIKLH